MRIVVGCTDIMVAGINIWFKQQPTKIKKRGKPF